MRLLYLGGALLVLAQIVGIYGLVTRKADLVLSLVVGTILMAGVVVAGLGAYHEFFV